MRICAALSWNCSASALRGDGLHARRVERVEAAQVDGQPSGRQLRNLIGRRARLVPSGHKRKILRDRPGHYAEGHGTADAPAGRLLRRRWWPRRGDGLCAVHAAHGDVARDYRALSDVFPRPHGFVNRDAQGSRRHLAITDFAVEDVRGAATGWPPADQEVEIRGVLFDVGQMSSDDSRLSAAGVRTIVESLSPDRWPARNTLFALTSATWVDASRCRASVRTVVFGRTPSRASPSRSAAGSGRRTSTETCPLASSEPVGLRAPGGDAAIWVTGRRPRGKGIDLDPTTRRGAGTWLEATGAIRFENGLARLEATAWPRANPLKTRNRHSQPRHRPSRPGVIFSAPLDGESDVDPAVVIRVQFSRDMRDASFEEASRWRTTVTCRRRRSPSNIGPPRAVEIRFKSPLVRERGRGVPGVPIVAPTGRTTSARDQIPDEEELISEGSGAGRRATGRAPLR